MKNIMNIRFLMTLAVVVTMAMSGCDNKDNGYLHEFL